MSQTSSLWARGDFLLRWLEDGKPRHEVGEGHLMLRLPDRAAIIISKMGTEFFWMACDVDRQWLVARGETEPVAVLMHRGATLPQDADVADLAALLAELPLVLGMMELPADGASLWIVRQDLFREMISLCIVRDGRERRVHFHAGTLLPLRVEVFDAGSGENLLTSSLTGYAPMELSDPSLPRPLMPTRIRLLVPSRGAELEIEAGVPRDRSGIRGAIDDRVFHLDAALKSMYIDPDEVMEFR